MDSLFDLRSLLSEESIITTLFLQRSFIGELGFAKYSHFNSVSLKLPDNKCRYF